MKYKKDLIELGIFHDALVVSGPQEKDTDYGKRYYYEFEVKGERYLMDFKYPQSQIAAGNQVAITLEQSMNQGKVAIVCKVFPKEGQAVSQASTKTPSIPDAPHPATATMPVNKPTHHGFNTENEDRQWAINIGQGWNIAAKMLGSTQKQFTLVDLEKLAHELADKIYQSQRTWKPKINGTIDPEDLPF